MFYVSYHAEELAWVKSKWLPTSTGPKNILSNEVQGSTDALVCCRALIGSCMGGGTSSLSTVCKDWSGEVSSSGGLEVDWG